MKKEDYLSEAEVAELLRIKRVTLQKNRYVGKKHPPYIKFGTTVLYPRTELEQWLKSMPVCREVAVG